MTYRFVALLLVYTPAAAASQGLPFHTETALTMAFEERGIRAFGSAQTRGDVELYVSPIMILPYAPHHRVTTKVVIPLVYKRLAPDQGARYSNAGFGDVSVGIKWAFFARNHPDGTARLAVAGSLSLPTGSTDAAFDNGVAAPRPLQLGRGGLSGRVALIGTLVRGQWGLSADLGRAHSMSDDGFHFGTETVYDLAIGFRLPRQVETIRTQTVQFYVEWNGSVTAYSSQDGAELPNSGGHVAYLSPGVQWVVFPQLLFESSVQIPVIQHHNGAQSDFGIRPALGLRFVFF